MKTLTPASVVRQEKVVYTWTEPRPRITVPARLKFRSVLPKERDVFLQTVREAISGSLDSHDKARLQRMPALDVAMEYWQPDPKYFAYDLAWWQLAFLDQAIVGFTQPVAFAGRAKSGLEEATIHYIGVLPAYRGRGYIFDLLSAATRMMQDVGVWRIYCDTDVRNSPMIEAFRTVGYEKGETRIVTHSFE